MEKTKLLSLENDGLNLAVDEQYLYVRCKRAMYKYNLHDMNLLVENNIFKKNDKAQNF